MSESDLNKHIKKKSISDSCLASDYAQQAMSTPLSQTSFHHSLKKNKSELFLKKKLFKNIICAFKAKKFNSKLNLNSTESQQRMKPTECTQIKEKNMFNIETNEYYNTQYAIELEKVAQNYEIIKKTMLENIEKTLNQHVNLEELEVKAENLNREALNLQLNSRLLKRKFYDRHKKLLIPLMLLFILISIFICVFVSIENKNFIKNNNNSIM
jgi:hypothetical protein